MMSGQPLDVLSPTLGEALDMPRRLGALTGDRRLSTPMLLRPW
jgi:hypothetical protein